jgi:prepilin-type N-terminal cleavage/methylation domain-containing protein
MKKGFTLIELMISITILSIIMLFLYKTYADMNVSNKIYLENKNKLDKFEKIKKITFIDLLTALNGSIKVVKENKNRDILFMQTPNSLHRRIMPYVTYIVKHSKLYRVETLYPFSNPSNTKNSIDVDFIGSVRKFRIYSSKDKNNSMYLLDIEFSNNKKILQKIKPFNEY